MKFPFRLTLLTVLLLLLGGTVLALGLTSHFYARSNADDLASQLLEQAAARTDQQIDRLLRQATEQSQLMRGHLQSGRVRLDDPAAFVAASGDALAVAGELTGLFIGLEASGDSVGVSRLSGRPTVWQSRHNARTGVYDVREYLLADYPRAPFAVDERMGGGDARGRPWYEAARAARRPVWTETFVFLGVGDVRGVHGVSYATPVAGPAGRLDAVLIADFELKQLCEYFRRSLQIGQEGLPFVIETRRDGSRRVIAHPQTELLVRAGGDGAAGATELRTPEEFPDPRVSVLAAEVAAGDPESFTGSAAPLRFRAEGRSYLALVRRLRGEEAPPWVICVVLPESEILGRVHRSNQVVLFVGAGVLLVGLLLSLFVAAQVARPLEKLAADTAAIGEFRLDSRPVPHSLIREVDSLALAVENMKGGLRSFQKYVPADLVRSLISSGQDARRGGEVRALSIFFSDVVDFTAIAEEMGPEQLVAQLSEYLDTVSQQIRASGGTVDKFIGDVVMAFWGAPARDPAHALTACRAALACQEALDRLHQRWRAEGKRPFATRIGVHTGEVVVGNVGSEARLNYTIIGDAVNLASRLEGLNKVYGTRIIVSETALRQAGPEVIARPIDFVAVKGKRQPVLIYELLGLRPNAAGEELAALHGEALAAYRARDWARAVELFERVRAQRPDDGPAGLLIARCLAYQADPPGPNWDGVHRHAHK